MLPARFTPQLLSVLKAGYTRAMLKEDAIAGLTVAVVALPLSMALAIASGTSPDKGLITAIVAGFLISLLGGSRVQVGGPTGAFVVVVYGVIAQHGYDGLVLAVFMAGLMLVVAGYAGLGQLIRFVPYPVITGFTSGIAVIIASSQIMDFLGLQIADIPANFILRWQAYLEHLHSINITTVFLGVLALTVIIESKRLTPKLPAFLLAIAVCSLVAMALSLPVETIGSRFTHLPQGLPAPSLPAWSIEKIGEVTPAAFTIAFLAGIEALLAAVVADGMTGYKHRPNQELVGQGVANIASSCFGGLPATGALARTTANIKANGKTPVAGMLHSVFLLIFMYLAMPVMAYVPMAVLAAILFVVAWGMSEARSFIRIFKVSTSDRVILVLTFLLTVLVDLTVAIAVGITLASLLFMRHMSLTLEVQNRAQQTEEDDENQSLELPNGVEVLQINGPIFFGIANDLLDTLKAMGDMPKVLILRMRYVPYLDASGEAILQDIVRQCQENDSQLILSGLRAQPLKVVKKTGVLQTKGIFVTLGLSSALAKAKTLL